MTNSQRTRAHLIEIIRDMECRMHVGHLSGLSRMRKGDLVAALQLLVDIAETDAHAENKARRKSWEIRNVKANQAEKRHSVTTVDAPPSRADYLAHVAKVADEWDAQGLGNLANGMRAAHGIAWPTRDDLVQAEAAVSGYLSV